MYVCVCVRACMRACVRVLGLNFLSGIRMNRPVDAKFSFKH